MKKSDRLEEGLAVVSRLRPTRPDLSCYRALADLARVQGDLVGSYEKRLFGKSDRI